MDSGNITEPLGANSQPADTVVVDAEKTEATPQAEATEESELYVEVEGDQQDTPNSMDERQTKAAWKEEKRKRKEKEQARKAEKERADKLEAELKELRSQVNNVTRGEKPDPFEFNTKEEFYAALAKWQDQGKPAEQKPDVKPKAQTFSLSDDQEFHLESSERAIRKSLKDYDDVKGKVGNELNRAFNLPGDYPILDEIAAFSHTYDADPAKVVYALNKIPGKMEELAKNASNPAQLGKILRDLSSKVKVKDKKPIDSKPEPKLSSSGAVNVLNKEVENAFNAYKQSGSEADHRKLVAARKRLKNSKQGD